MVELQSDTNTIAYHGVFRIYRNTVVAFLRLRLSEIHGEHWDDLIKKPFQKAKVRADGTKTSEWDELVANADGARRVGLIEGDVRDAADYLSVNHFYNLFDSHFADLWPDLASDKETKAALLHWARGVKLVRDFVAHPSELGLSFSDAYVLLDSARRILQKIDREAARQLADSQAMLVNQPEAGAMPVATYLPPRENVVLDFVGRRSILADLHRWFADPLGRRWLLAGTDGGRGKSAIAYEFAEQITRNRPKNYALVAWISAKQRQYQQGQIVTMAPDFVDLESAIDRLLVAYGVKSDGTLPEKKALLLEQLTDLPALLVIDDVDSLTGVAEQAIEFFAIDVAATPSKVLFTARRVPLGLGATVTFVDPFPDDEAREFVDSRLHRYQIDRTRLSEKAIDDVLRLTDRSALYLDDLLRLCKNLSPAEAINVWSKNRGAKVREYALKREVELLTPPARKLLLACALSSSPISLGELEVVTNVSKDEAIDALTELDTYYLVPQPRFIDDQPRYALNSNTQRLVQEVYGQTAEGRALKAAINHVFGSGAGPEAEHEASSICQHAVVLMSADRSSDAATLLNKALETKYPNHPRLLGQLGWVYKKWDPPRRSEARDQFQRAYRLNNRIPIMYWHWADMESQVPDRQAQSAAALKGIERCGEEPQLLLMAAEAANRVAYELNQLHESRAVEEHERALDLYKRGIDASKRVRVEGDQVSRMYAGVTRVARMLRQKKVRESYLEAWESLMPADRRLLTEKTKSLAPNKLAT